ncbi:FGGY-family carbohydrate kinase [Parasalinivibrio latis]|uniref:FGGY-family carbohydrate kinase n=1 Tax=Parasalinivibrio latis TaxID=2952610 RepID=UPI0030DF52A3
MGGFYIGIDVGSGSARAGVFDANGVKAGEASCPIDIYRPQPDFVEQSSDNIWQAVCDAVKKAVLQAGINPDDVNGIGVDATCSLVVLDTKGLPLTVSPTGQSSHNIIMWMDHRALHDAEAINATQLRVLEYVGNAISPEMQTPKLRWLKREMPHTWKRAGYFFDLPDFLTWKATGDDSRSLCSTVCKWTYLGHDTGWDKDYFETIGLVDLLDNGAIKIGNRILPMGQPVGHGLTANAAAELGLVPGTPVATSMIDAHAGGLGVLGISEGESLDFDRRLALIGGTSSCHMVVSPEPRKIDGVWGPYYHAMVPGFWLNEGGQSATGSLVDHMIANHAAYPDLMAKAKQEKVSVYALLNSHLAALAGDKEISQLTESLHILPYFHGNRSPRANPSLTGMVSGLKLDHSLDSLALQYLATIQAIALGTRHIIDVMNYSGYNIDTILACGGGTKNPVFLQQHANATGCIIHLPQEPEAVLLGSAMLGAVAGGAYPGIPAAMSAMSRPGRTIYPQPDTADFFDAKYRVFHEMYRDQMKYKAMM